MKWFVKVELCKLSNCGGVLSWVDQVICIVHSTRFAQRTTTMLLLLLAFSLHSTANTPLTDTNPYINRTYSSPPPHHTSLPPPPPPPFRLPPPPPLSTSSKCHLDTIVIIVVSILVAILLIGVGIWYLYQYMEKKRVKREVAQVR
ncbi:hypothetical protein P8452_26302 [Trifolium repens]|nr:hypothetical protein P8452_26302 [Trifolium repens]